MSSRDAISGVPGVKSAHRAGLGHATQTPDLGSCWLSWRTQSKLQTSAVPELGHNYTSRSRVRIDLVVLFDADRNGLTLLRPH